MALRNERKLTQEALAWEASLAKSMLSRIENGERLPSVETLEALAKCLGVEPRDLLLFPGRSAIDEAMDLVRRGGPQFASEVIALAGRVEPTKRESSTPDRSRRR